MDKIFNWVSIACGITGGVLAWVFGEWNIVLWSLLTLMVIDCITGWVKGTYTKQLSSKVGYKGLLKKVMILCIVATANIVQYVVGENVPIREIVISFFIANEGISILENVSAVNEKIPQKLKDILLQLRENGEDDYGNQTKLDDSQSDSHE